MVSKVSSFLILFIYAIAILLISHWIMAQSINWYLLPFFLLLGAFIAWFLEIRNCHFSQDLQKKIAQSKFLTDLDELTLDIIQQTDQQIDHAQGQSKDAIANVLEHLSCLVNYHNQIDAKFKINIHTGNKIDKLIKSNHTYFDELKEKLEKNKNSREKSLVFVHQLAEDIFLLTEQSRTVVDLMWRLNLLALNAHVESIRAEDEGRCFSIVANQLRDLSIQSSKSVEKIIEITNQLNLAMTRAFDTAFTNEENNDAVEKALHNMTSNTLNKIQNYIDTVGSSIRNIREKNKLAQSSTNHILQNLQYNIDIFDLSSIRELLLAHLTAAKRAKP